MLLRVLSSDGSKTEHSFSEDNIHIGRDPDSTLVLSDRNVSRRHALIYRTHQGRWMIRDTDSRYGLTVAGVRIKKDTPLKEGDLVEVGPFVLQVFPPVKTPLFIPAMRRSKADAMLSGKPAVLTDSSASYQDTHVSESAFRWFHLLAGALGLAGLVWLLLSYVGV